MKKQNRKTKMIEDAIDSFFTAAAFAQVSDTYLSKFFNDGEISSEVKQGKNVSQENLGELDLTDGLLSFGYSSNSIECSKSSSDIYTVKVAPGRYSVILTNETLGNVKAISFLRAENDYIYDNNHILYYPKKTLHRFINPVNKAVNSQSVKENLIGERNSVYIFGAPETITSHTKSRGDKLSSLAFYIIHNRNNANSSKSNVGLAYLKPNSSAVATSFKTASILMVEEIDERSHEVVAYHFIAVQVTNDEQGYKGALNINKSDLYRFNLRDFMLRIVFGVPGFLLGGTIMSLFNATPESFNDYIPWGVFFGLAFSFIIVDLIIKPLWFVKDKNLF